MDVQFTLTAKDHWEFYKFAMWNVPSVRSAVAGSLFGLFTIIFLIGAFFSALLRTLDVFLLVIMPITWFAINACFYFWRRHQMVNARVHKTPGAIGECTVFLSSDGIRANNSIKELFTSWLGIVRIAESSSYIFIFFEDAGAYLIPKRAFRNQELAQSFFDQATQYWRQAIE